MKKILNLHIIAIGTFIVFIVLGLACASTITSPGTVYYESPSRPALSSEQRKNLTEADIDLLIQKGDEAYENEKYSVAKDYYYEVLLAMPNPSVYVLVSYGACLANLQSYENAITMFNLALEKDPNNETAKENIRICRQLIAAQTAEQRRIEQEQERQQQENLNNIIASMNALSQSIAQNNQGQSGGSVSGGSQGQAKTLSGASSGGSNINTASMQSEYNTREKATIQSLNTCRQAESDYKAAKISLSEYDRYYDAFINQQKGLKSYREDCNRKGADIKQSYYETVKVNPPPNR